MLIALRWSRDSGFPRWRNETQECIIKIAINEKVRSHFTTKTGSETRTGLGSSFFKTLKDNRILVL